MSTGWRLQGACNGTDLGLWFGPDGETAEQQQEREANAKDICSACPVRWKCGSYAIAAPEKWGVWGQFGEDERARERSKYLRRQRSYAS